MKERKHHTISALLLMLYLIILTWLVLLKLGFNYQELVTGVHRLNLIPFKGTAIINGALDKKELLANVAVFVPFGLLLSMNFSKMRFSSKWLLIFLTSFGYEAIQYWLTIGGADITDLINNTLGGFIGLVLYDILELIFRKKARLNAFLNICGVILLIIFLGLAVMLYLGNK
ncbi:VanZ family protein [Vagococcus zengguangii]|nr:VanZ family protein [Vagococcus zengguangii]